MKRDNMFDVAIRDMDSVRNRARSTAIETAGVGACMDGACDSAKNGPVASSFDCNDLSRDWEQTVVVTRALAGRAVVTVTFNPLDQFFCPVAIAGVGFDSVDGQTPRTFQIIQASIRGCLQYPWQNATDTVAGAAGYIHSDEIDPRLRSGCACAVNYGCFSNVSGSQAQLQLVLGALSAVGTTTDIKITLWGQAYSCCPGWTNVREYNKPRDSMTTAGATRPLGSARDRQPLFK